MSEQPPPNGPDDEAGTAPWERPRRWTPAPEPTRIDDLLARLEPEDTGRRQRRRAEGDETEAVSAAELIASLQKADAATDSADDETLPPTAVADGQSPAAPADSVANDPPAAGSADEPTQLIDQGAVAEASAAAAATPIGEAAGSAPLEADDPSGATVALGPDPDATTLIPRYAEAAAIRASLTRQAGGVVGDTSVSPEDPAPAAVGGRKVPEPEAAARQSDGRPPRGFLYAGRSVVAVLAALLLITTGFEYTLLRSTDAALKENSVEALQTDDSNIKTPSRSTAATTGGTAGELPPVIYEPENILLLGSDTRAGSNGDASNSDSTTEGVAQSDTLMIAHVSGDRQHVTIISIPRDLRVDAPQCKAWSADTMEMSDEDFQITPGEQWKITNAYAVGGPACTVKAVQQLTGLKIDRVIGIDFMGFKTMVDALGGIHVNVCGPIDDAELGLVVATGGEQVVRGDQALSLVRARKVIGDPTGDFGRIRRQQVVLSSLLRQAISAGTLLNPAKLNDFLDAFVDSTYTSNVTVDSMLELAKSFGDLDPSRITFYTLPTVDSGDPNDDALVLDPKAEAVFDALLNDQSLPGETPSTTSKAPTSAASSGTTSAGTTTSPSTSASVITIAPDQVDLEVVNVAGRPGVAGEGMAVLNELGFAITEEDLTLPEDAPIYEDVTVLYSPGNEAAALTVAAAVPGAILETQDGLGGRVRLLLGTSWDGTAQAVSVGQPVPTSIGTPSPAPSTGATSAPEDGTQGTDGAGETATQPPSTTGPTLNSTDLSSVNAAQALCA